jgi:hypothetical protein
LNRASHIQIDAASPVSKIFFARDQLAPNNTLCPDQKHFKPNFVLSTIFVRDPGIPISSQDAFASTGYRAKHHTAVDNNQMDCITPDNNRIADKL